MEFSADELALERLKNSRSIRLKKQNQGQLRTDRSNRTVLYRGHRIDPNNSLVVPIGSDEAVAAKAITNGYITASSLIRANRHTIDSTPVIRKPSNVKPVEPELKVFCPILYSLEYERDTPIPLLAPTTGSVAGEPLSHSTVQLYVANNGKVTKLGMEFNKYNFPMYFLLSVEAGKWVATVRVGQNTIDNSDGRHRCVYIEGESFEGNLFTFPDPIEDIPKDWRSIVTNSYGYDPVQGLTDSCSFQFRFRQDGNFDKKKKLFIETRHSFDTSSILKNQDKTIEIATYKTTASESYCDITPRKLKLKEVKIKRLQAFDNEGSLRYMTSTENPFVECWSPYITIK
jgi:hypothetical protein